MKALLLILLILLTHTGHAQTSPRRALTASVFNNAIAFPFSGRAGVFHKPLHPGLSLGYSKRINHHDHHQLSAAIKTAYFYQQFVQHGIQVYPELDYSYRFRFGVGAGLRLGGGYMLSIPDVEQFRLNDHGEYERIRPLRSAFVFSLSPVIGYDLSRNLPLPVYAFVQYQLFFQTPFVRSYAPVLPNAALHVGAYIYLRDKK
jgi:hypothetical protein